MKNTCIAVLVVCATLAPGLFGDGQSTQTDSVSFGLAVGEKAPAIHTEGPVRKQTVKRNPTRNERNGPAFCAFSGFVTVLQSAARAAAKS